MARAVFIAAPDLGNLTTCASGSVGLGRGGLEEAEEVIMIPEAEEITVTWVGGLGLGLVIRGFKGGRGGLRGS